jgi:hypothetical protein
MHFNRFLEKIGHVNILIRNALQQVFDVMLNVSANSSSLSIVFIHVIWTNFEVF